MLNLFSLISLRSKILLGMLLSLLPMLAITGITYHSNRSAIFEHSERIITLVARHRAVEINAFLARQQNLFLEWVDNDVFGMAIEFQTINELGNHFKSMLEGQHGFGLLVLTDLKGSILTAVASHDSQDLNQKALEGQGIRTILASMGQVNRWASLIEHHLAGFPQFTSKYTYLLIAAVKDSASHTNGYLLAFVNWSFLQDQVMALAQDNRANGFPDARVTIQDTTTNTILGHSDPSKVDTRIELGKEIAHWLETSENRSMHKVEVDTVAEYVTAVPLQIAPGPLSRSEKVSGKPHLFLTCFVPEQDIVADVKENLRTSIIIGVAGGGVIILLALFFMADVKGKFNKFLRVFEAMSQGNIKGQLTIAGRDEFAAAAVSFNRLVEYLQEVLLVCEGVAMGNYDRTIEKSSPEDMLSDAISRMTTTLQEVTSEQAEQNWFKTGQAELNDRMRGEQDVDVLARNTISFLAEYLNAQVGALYLTESDGSLS
jgi:methyl-accepting chemotaxis protein